MRAFFSEFSYGYALTYELTTKYGGLLKGAPRLPSQRTEREEGFDIEFPIKGFPLFLQFKRSQYMMRSTAAEWSFFGDNYYRFDIHPLRHSPQHHLLIDLEMSGNYVYYAVPGFYEAEDLNDAFRKSEVTSRSLFFRPTDIGRLPDADDHRVAFRLSDSFAYFFSKKNPDRIPISGKGTGFIEEIEVRRSRDEYGWLTEDSFDQLADTMTRMVLEQLEFGDVDPRNIVGELPPYARVAYMARMFFDAEMMIVAV